MDVRDAGLVGLGYEKITGLNVVKGLNPPEGTRIVLLKVETQPVRWRAYLTAGTPTDPTATDGMLIDIGDEFTFTGQPASFRAIETAASATLHAHYFK